MTINKPITVAGCQTPQKIGDREANIVVRYDKWHACSTGDCFEKRFFKTGERPLETFDFLGVRVGLCICYDIRFPELTRYLAVEKRISLLLHPGGWPRDKGFLTAKSYCTVRLNLFFADLSVFPQIPQGGG